MVRTRATLRRRPAINNFNNRRFAAAKEMENARQRRGNSRFKIKFMLPQDKDVEVKQRGRVVRHMRVRKPAIFPANIRERRYPRN